MSDPITDYGDDTIAVGTCKCGGYGQVFNEKAEKELGMCHRELQEPEPDIEEYECDFSYVAIAIKGEKVKNEFWGFQCPKCKEEVKYGINELPTVDTPFPCGCSDSWIVRYYDDPDECPR